MLTRKIISPFLILLYLTAVIGIGFYNCHCEHSEKLAIITYNECECAHHEPEATSGYEHKLCEETSCQHLGETCLSDDGGCCTIVYKSIKIDQESSAQKSNTNLNTSFSFAFIIPSFADIPEIASVNDSFDFSKSPPESLKTSLIYHNCQLRL